MNEVPWHADDLFWEKMAPIMFSPSRMEEAKEEVTLLIELLGIGSEESILDLSCGIGRHSNEFARRGHKATGVDRTPNFLKIAKETAENENLQAEYILEDIRNFRRDNTFDVAIIMHTSFGFFDSPHDQEVVLRNTLASLKPGGRFVMDALGKEVLARVFKSSSVDIGDYGIIAEIRQPIDDWSRMQNQIFFIDPDNSVYHREITYYIYSAAEFKSLLLNTGFSRAEAYGGFDGSEYNESAKRLVCIGWK